MNDYLTEQNLGMHLTNIFQKEWIHDKAFITRKRPDYRNDILKLIVEFDGPQHYTNSTRILQDYERDKFYTNNGYKTVRIPMFVQLDSRTIDALFGLKLNYNCNYKHGFISDASTLILPADYCELGIERFQQDLVRFACIKDDIIESLKIKVQKLKDIRLVLPKSLHYLLG